MQCRDCRFMYVIPQGVRCLMAEFEGFAMIKKIKNNLSYDDCTDFRPIAADRLDELNANKSDEVVK